MAAWLGTWLIYGGAAQLAVLDVLAHGSGWVAAAVVGLLVNLRLAAYATAMVPEWRTRLAAASAAGRGSILTDAPWALARARTRGAQSYYLGAALTLLVALADGGHRRGLRRRQRRRSSPSPPCWCR